MRYEDMPRDEKTGAIEAEKVEFPVRFRLLTPLETAGGKRGELEMREPTVLDLETSNREKSDVARSVALLSNLLEVSPGEARRLGTRDYSRLTAAVAAFL